MGAGPHRHRRRRRRRDRSSGRCCAGHAWGFRLGVLGGNAEAARRAGLRTSWLSASALMVGGALAGLGGMLQVAGVERPAPARDDERLRLHRRTGGLDGPSSPAARHCVGRLAGGHRRRRQRTEDPCRPVGCLGQHPDGAAAARRARLGNTTTEGRADAARSGSRRRRAWRDLAGLRDASARR